MLLAAARDLGLDLSRSWMVGDKICDLKAGAAAGCRTVLVRTGYGAEVADPLSADELRLVGVVPDLPAAVELWEQSRRVSTESPSASISAERPAS